MSAPTVGKNPNIRWIFAQCKIISNHYIPFALQVSAMPKLAVRAAAKPPPMDGFTAFLDWHTPHPKLGETAQTGNCCQGGGARARQSLCRLRAKPKPATTRGSIHGILLYLSHFKFRQCQRRRLGVRSIFAPAKSTFTPSMALIKALPAWSWHRAYTDVFTASFSGHPDAEF